MNPNSALSNKRNNLRSQTMNLNNGIENGLVSSLNKKHKNSISTSSFSSRILKNYYFGEDMDNDEDEEEEDDDQNYGGDANNQMNDNNSENSENMGKNGGGTRRRKGE